MTTSFDRDWRRIKELVEVLAGERGDSARPDRAVRLRELESLIGTMGTGSGGGGGGGGTSGVQSIAQGQGISVDATNPKIPKISADVVEAPDDGKLYVRSNKGWVEVSLPPPPVAHKYWRLYIMETQSPDSFFCNLAELELRASISGPNLALGGAASANSEIAATPASATIDGSAATFWSTATGSIKPAWLAVNMTAAAVIRAVSLVAADNASRALRTPRDFAIQWSDNGTQWTTATVVTGQTAWQPGERRVFTF